MEAEGDKVLVTREDAAEGEAPLHVPSKWLQDPLASVAPDANKLDPSHSLSEQPAG